MRGSVVSLVSACLFWPQLLLAALPAELGGTWRGVVEVDGTAIQLQATLLDRSDGFELDLAVPGAAPVKARFVPSERSQVFEPAAAGRGLFGFFDGGDRSNPFDGAPLVWARTTTVGLVAYRLTIGADGSMSLVRIAVEPLEGALQLRIEQRIDSSAPRRLEAVLERVG